MRILLLNEVCGVTSTGRICADLAAQLRREGHQVKVAYGREPVPEDCREGTVRIGSDWGVRLHGAMTRLGDLHGLCSRGATRRFLAWAEDFDPELLWMHNLHGYYLQYELLFQWIKSRPEMQVKWTLHDCWSFTGHCPYFSMIGCDRWQTECSHCPQKKRYPASLFRDGSRQNFRRKKAAMTGVKNLTLITPSQWLKDLVQQSFLRDYPVEVVPNPVNREVFRPTPGNFREKYGLENRFMVLGVGTLWAKHKGLEDFVALRGMLGEHFAIVLVGLEPKQIAQMPEGILALPRTDSPRELAEIYTAADLLVSASKEEVFGMTIAEADACGTPSLVYRGTACEEVALSCGGRAVEQGPEHLRDEILKMAQEAGK